jgi:hypothetical protein
MVVAGETMGKKVRNNIILLNELDPLELQVRLNSYKTQSSAVARQVMELEVVGESPTKRKKLDKDLISSQHNDVMDAALGEYMAKEDEKILIDNDEITNNISSEIEKGLRKVHGPEFDDSKIEAAKKKWRIDLNRTLLYPDNPKYKSVMRAGNNSDKASAVAEELTEEWKKDREKVLTELRAVGLSIDTDFNPNSSSYSTTIILPDGSEEKMSFEDAVDLYIEAYKE